MYSVTPVSYTHLDVYKRQVIVPFVLAYVYMAEGTIPFFMLTVGIGEVISCYVLGMILSLIHI